MESGKLLESAKEAALHFAISDELGMPKPWGNGHINDTFLIEGEKRYILQRMNKNIFTKPLELMENIVGVTRDAGDIDGDSCQGWRVDLPGRTGRLLAHVLHD